MRLLDRYVLRYFLLAYLVGFVSLLMLYIVIDLFSKFDEFYDGSQGVASLFENIGVYYLYRIPYFFQRLSGVFSLFAGMFALAWMERQNEIIAWLAAGIPTRRLVYPVLAATLLVVGLSVANREYLVPPLSAHLQRPPDDPYGQKQQFVQGCYDANRILIEGKVAYPERQAVEYGQVTLPSQLMGSVVHLHCVEMRYRPAKGTDSSGWWINAATPELMDCTHPALNWLGPGQYFLHTDVSFNRLTRRPNWFLFERTGKLIRFLTNEESYQRRDEMIALVHRRWTAPVLDFLVVLLSIPLLVGRPDRNIFLKVGSCMVLYVAIQLVNGGCGYLAEHEYLDPAFGAWLPVLFFGPFAITSLDTLRT